MASIISNAPRVTGAGAQAMPGRVSASMSVPFAGHFTRRPDTLGELAELLVPGSAVALVPDRDAAPWQWYGSRGKTQAAAHAAVHLRRSGSVDLVAWVDASGRASLLDGLASAAAQAGLDIAGGGEAAAAQLGAWLRVTRQPWLVVLDDLRDAADVAAMWPAGPAGITLVTARDPAVVADLPARLVPVPCYSQREAVAALSAWLSTDPDHRSGQLDLALALECEPTAIAHAGSVISTAELTCREYHDLFLRQKAQIEAATGRQVPAATVTWALSAEHAEVLEPGTGTWPLLDKPTPQSPVDQVGLLLISVPVDLSSRPERLIDQVLLPLGLDVPGSQARALLREGGELIVDKQALLHVRGGQPQAKRPHGERLRAQGQEVQVVFRRGNPLLLTAPPQSRERNAP